MLCIRRYMQIRYGGLLRLAQHNQRSNVCCRRLQTHGCRACSGVWKMHAKDAELTRAKPHRNWFSGFPCSVVSLLFPFPGLFHGWFSANSPIPQINSLAIHCQTRESASMGSVVTLDHGMDHGHRRIWDLEWELAFLVLCLLGKQPHPLVQGVRAATTHGLYTYAAIHPYTHTPMHPPCPPMSALRRHFLHPPSRLQHIAIR